MAPYKWHIKGKLYRVDIGLYSSFEFCLRSFTHCSELLNFLLIVLKSCGYACIRIMHVFMLLLYRCVLIVQEASSPSHLLPSMNIAMHFEPIASIAHLGNILSINDL